MIKYRLLSMTYAAVSLLMWPMTALAQDEAVPDARLEGYQTSVQLEQGSTAMTYLLMIVLTVMCLVALFKNAKRTHMD